jgi:hypothetical protein
MEVTLRGANRRSAWIREIHEVPRQPILRWSTAQRADERKLHHEAANSLVERARSDMKLGHDCFAADSLDDTFLQSADHLAVLVPHPSSKKMFDVDLRLLDAHDRPPGIRSTT